MLHPSFKFYRLQGKNIILAMNLEKVTKQEIVKSAEAVKRKVKMIRDMTSENEKVLETMFKPITDPLNQMAEQSRMSDKNKNEIGISPECHSTPKKIKLDLNDTKPSSSHNDTVFKLNHDDIEDSSTISDKEDNIDTSEKSETENEEGLSATSDNETFESVSSLDRNFSSPLSFSVKKFEDIPFGVRIERGKLMMGSQRVLVAERTITINANTYAKTPGLVQLLFKKSPNLELVTAEDKDNYRLILNQTNAHRRDFDPKKPIKSNRGTKYLHVIKPLFKLFRNCESTENLAAGSGLSMLKKVKPNTDYVYWDDPNELVERLKLLFASREAGNSGLDNEIISIIEELRENGFKILAYY